MWTRTTGLIAAIFLGACLTASPARAFPIIVRVDPMVQVLPLSAGSASVDLRADIPEADAIRGWGMDLNFGTPGVAGASRSFTLNSLLFDFVPTADGDGMAGLVPFFNAPVFGIDVLLGTLTISLDGLGTTALVPSDDNPADLTEGFALEPVGPPGQFADVTYVPGSLTVVPEPTAMAMVLAGSVLIRRRRTRS